MGFGDPNDMIRTQTVNPYYNYEYPGTYNIRLTVTDTTGATSTLTRPISVYAPASTELSKDEPLKFPATSYYMQYFSLDVPAGAKSVTFTLTSSDYSDVASLYLKARSPTLINADCESLAVRGARATCTISNPAPGTYYATVSPSTDIAEATIVATYTQ